MIWLDDHTNAWSGQASNSVNGKRESPQRWARRKEAEVSGERTENQRTDDGGQMTASQMVNLSNSQMVMNGVNDQ